MKRHLAARGVEVEIDFDAERVYVIGITAYPDAKALIPHDLVTTTFKKTRGWSRDDG
jgi:hypothetical protein